MNKLNTFALNSRFTISDNVFSSEVDGEMVLLNLTSGIYFGLDPIGTRIWKLIEQSKTVSEIRSTLLEEYEVGVNDCNQAIQELLQELIDAKLIEVTSEVA